MQSEVGGREKSRKRVSQFVSYPDKTLLVRYSTVRKDQEVDIRFVLRNRTNSLLV